MDTSPQFFPRVIAGILMTGIFTVVIAGLLSLAHFLLTLPMRRAERARLFLDLIDSTIGQGLPVEETMISLSQSRDMSMGVGFHLVVAWLEQGLGLGDALAKVPRFLPPQVTAMLAASRRIGDLRKGLPACRQLLKDGVSKTRAAISYLVILTFVITPFGVWVAWILKVMVLPKFREIGEGSLGEGMRLANPDLIFNHFSSIILLQSCLLLLLWASAIVYIGGPRVAAWFPFSAQIQHWIPWRRKRLQRDFSTMLAILLDSGVSEPEAVTLAADCTANSVFQRRATRAVDSLKRGMKLTEAVQAMDDSGEFGWRLTNAFHGGGFLKALAGWHESLDAKAFQEEQAAAHTITSALVLWSGVFVGAVVISVFAFLVSITNGAVLW